MKHAVWAVAAFVTLGMVGTVPAQQMERNGFETRDTSWVRGAADAALRETAHEIADQNPHTGQYSEHVQLIAEKGSYIYYVYGTGKAAVGDDLSASVWVKANRPSLQLLARLVLPHEHSAGSLDQPLTTLIPGEAYQLVGRWQRLELRRPVKLAKAQQQLMQAQLKRPVDFSDAYVDQLVLNVYGGPGLADVWIDDLEIGPVAEAAPYQPASRPIGPGAGVLVPAPSRVANRGVIVEMNLDQLQVGGRRFFIRGIRHSDTPLETLRDTGFNCVWMDYATPRPLMEKAINLGFWIVPSVPVTGNDPHLVSTDNLGTLVTRFLDADAVLFWDLGGGLLAEQAPAVARAAAVVRAADPQRPLGADIWDGAPRYSRSLDLLGVHRWPLMTGLELTRYRDWLNERRQLARPGIFLWTWVQTHLPEWYTALVYEQSDAAGFKEPIGPQPEQIRLLTYIALASGCRGVGFWSDRYLADSHQGQDRLLTLALLNQELQMLEPMLLTADTDTLRWIGTSKAEVRAAVLHTDRGILVLPMWLGSGSQYVPGQSATARLTLTVPEVPDGTQAWQISPAYVGTLKTERVPGGTKVTIPNFGLTSAIVFTADSGPTGLVVRLQEQERRWRKLASQWAYDQARVEIEKVAKVEAQLEAAGHTLPDAKQLMDDARSRLQQSARAWESGLFREAYDNAEEALRPLRILMRGQWEQAIAKLDAPVASPYAVSFYTLPRHWQFIDEVRALEGNGTTRAWANVLPDGGFEIGPNQTAETWRPQEVTLDGDYIDLTAQRVTEQPHEGRQCLKLEIKVKTAQQPPAALERTFLALNSPLVHLPPGSLVRVSAWVRIPKAITASADGALFYDSAGGEPLAVRMTDKMPWKKVTLYRKVPASGILNVTLALTGIGIVYFDDVRIEPLSPAATPLRPGP